MGAVEGSFHEGANAAGVKAFALALMLAATPSASGSRVTWTYTDAYYKEYTRTTWNESAPRYGELLRNLDKYNDDLLAAASPRKGERVLDVATGPGEPALSLAPRVGPAGSVVGIDLSERMVEVARQNAKGVDNVEFRVMDAEHLAFPDASFDLAVCRFGLQIVTDPDRCIAEVRRVLRPGGRFAATVWGPGARVPALDVIIAPMLEYAEPDETGYIPTPYEMGGDGELAEILAKAGFRDVAEKRVVHDFTFRDARTFFDAVLKGTPVGHSLSEEDEPTQKAVLQKTARNLERWTLPDGTVRAPAEAVVVAGVRP